MHEKTLAAKPRPAFGRAIGIDYSGAATAETGLAGLRVYTAQGTAPPTEAHTPEYGRKHWSRRELAVWLTQRLGEDVPTIVGIDHGFSFPLPYFERYGSPRDWPAFLDDFQAFWPTDAPSVTVQQIRDGAYGKEGTRPGNARWRRLSEIRTGRAKSVFHFDVPGSVAKSTHAGLPWLRFLRRELGDRVHFWPFDGWDFPSGKSVVAECYPALWSRSFPREGRTQDQQDAYSLAAWLRRADADGALAACCRPALTASERATAAIEGWILGVA
ncbi:conserved hypothetical protein [Solidesulfovibrio fructosivorans JJ]]|uniref:DUF429 domain-containing protein n=1 Tax=Solidesulfovibrio fructosivorans JJ] TaxID=596151 RepID=E1JU63_SOLFR|nr:hypothetical protein [Solidesulfovibrio fructosivorans]EFL51993.1 conserved hypothetical protein [Solidesulfovibrio fructosivorans JJ]]